MPVVLILTVDYTLSHPYALRYIGERQIHVMYRTKEDAKRYIAGTELRFDPDALTEEDARYFFS